jgi:hypothetical protein
MSEPSIAELEQRIQELEGRARPRIGVRFGRRSLRRATIAIVAALAIALPAGVVAIHQFTDVPNSSPYHAAIGALKDAGITSGCTVTTYCPADPVRRESMAAFLTRGLGRMTGTEFYFPAITEGSAFATVSINTQGTAYLNARAAFYGLITPGAGGESYLCEHLVYLSVDGSDVFAHPAGNGYTTADQAPISYQLTPIALDINPVVNAGAHTVSLVYYGDTTGTCTFAVGRGSLTATVVPFGPTGGTATEPASDLGLGTEVTGNPK